MACVTSLTCLGTRFGRHTAPDLAGGFTARSKVKPDSLPGVLQPDDPSLPANGKLTFNDMNNAMMKDFMVREPLRMQLRGEFFNSFNQVNSAQPQRTVSSGSFDPHYERPGGAASCRSR
jgi:hypothetical protein